MTRPSAAMRALVWVGAVAAAPLAMAACGDDDGGGQPDGGGDEIDGGGESADASAGADADEGSTQNVALSFAARVGDQAASCGQTYDSVGTAETTIEVTDLRLFVSNVHLVTGDGTEVPVELEQDSIWQHEGVALLDFEDGSAGCSEFGNAELNDTVTGEVEDGEYTGVRFDVGVPFELNHINVDEADAPLSIPAMFWNWRGGYKFVRIEGETADEEPWIVHLGSTGCVSDAPADPPEEECSTPNRPAIALSDFDAGSDTIVLDLAELFADTDLDDESGGCQSFEDHEAACTPIFENLGIDWDTGECVDGCEAQSVFSIE